MKNSFKVIRKESIDIEAWSANHPKYNIIYEQDTTKDGVYGWIVFRTPQVLHELSWYEEEVKKNCSNRDHLKIIKAKVQHMPQRKKLEV